jgi:hypothetical protein
MAALVRIAGNAQLHLRDAACHEVRVYRFVGSHRVLSAAELGKFYDLRRAFAKLGGNREQGTL